MLLVAKTVSFDLFFLENLMEFSSNPHIWLWNERNIMYDKAQIKKHKLMKITVFTAER